jgi:hypothetical protein
MRTSERTSLNYERMQMTPRERINAGFVTEKVLRGESRLE